MGKINKFAVASVLGASLISGTVSAANITFGGVAPTDGSGLTSQFIDPADAQGTNGYFIETFDRVPGAGPGPTDGYVDAGFEDRCTVNSGSGTLPGVAINPTPAGDVNDTIGVRIGSVPNVAAAPANDTTCFGYLTNANVGGPATVTFDYSVLLSNASDIGITYLGFYWGSVDNYNTFDFFSGGSLVASLTGTQLLNALGGAPGDQQGDGSNAYVNIFFDFAEAFDTMVVTTTGIAAEFDNIVIGLSSRPVPAPVGVALLGLGLLAVSIRSRLKK